MEKFFRVEVGSLVDVAYHRWDRELEKIENAIGAFFKEKGIESTRNSYGKTGMYGTHAVEGDEKNIQLGLIPTEKDLSTFGNQLCKKENDHDIRYFKKNSEIRKEFATKAIELSLCKLMKPSPGGFAGFYKYTPPNRSRLFEYNGVLYGSIEAENVENPLVEGIIEMSGSDFYKIIEQIEAQENGGTENGTN